MRHDTHDVSLPYVHTIFKFLYARFERPSSFPLPVSRRKIVFYSPLFPGKRITRYRNGRGNFHFVFQLQANSFGIAFSNVSEPTRRELCRRSEISTHKIRRPPLPESQHHWSELIWTIVTAGVFFNRIRDFELARRSHFFVITFIL